MKESRKVEEIILAFVSASTKALRKESDLADGGWKQELNQQILLFLDLLGDNLSSVGSVGGDLRTRLATHRARLEADIEPPPPPAPKTEENVNDVMTPGNDHAPNPTDVVRELMGIPSSDFETKLSSLRPICTADAAIVDLKVSVNAPVSDAQVMLQRLSTDKPVPYSPSDFESDSQWASYRAKEISALTDLTVDIMKLDPTSRERSVERPDSVDLVHSLDGLKLEDRNLTFVPSEPRDAYREVLKVCLNCDLEVLRTLPEDQDVSLGILSAEHVALLAECALRWRIPRSFCAWVFLESIQHHYEQGEIPPECVFEAAGEVGRVSQEQDVSSWSLVDQQGLQSVLARRNTFFLNDIEIALGTPGGYLSEEFIQAAEHWNQLDGEEVEHPVFQRTQRAICDRLRQQAYAYYIEEASERYSHEGGKNREFAMALASWIESSAKRLDKMFPQPITT